MRARKSSPSFDTRTELGLSTLRAWAAWIGRLVADADDGQLTHRFAVLREQSPWMTGMIGHDALRR